MKKPREAKRMSDEAVKERTGKTWLEWFKILDKAGAKKWRHQDISAYLAKTHKVGPWWAQSDCCSVRARARHPRTISEVRWRICGVRKPHVECTDDEVVRIVDG